MFKEFSVIEHFGNFFRFRINTSSKPGTIFGILENNVDLLTQKRQLQIEQYSVAQATLEQIFNMFAKNQIEKVLAGSVIDQIEVRDEKVVLFIKNSSINEPVSDEEYKSD